MIYHDFISWFSLGFRAPKSKESTINPLIPGRFTKPWLLGSRGF